MPITHINRQGKTYYLHQGLTKKGNPKYYFSLKNDGELVEQLPKGYEVYENPNAQVFLRRIKPQQITMEERSVVENGVRQLTQTQHARVDVRGKAIIVYTADQDVGGLETLFSDLGGWRGANVNVEQFLSYSPMLRFVLDDARQRHFVCERFCFRGSIDDWIFISGLLPLADLVRTFVPHLGAESFFELY